ncbi:hypothetical protein Tco_1276785, partial [Tanacetum coccineum]
TRSLIEHLSTDLPSTYKGLMEKTYTWIEAREVATNRAPSDRRENFKRSRKSSWDNNKGQKGRDRNQIEEAVKSGQLSHLVKGIKKERDESYTKNEALEGFTSEGREITFPLRGSNSSAPVVIKAKIFGRETSISAFPYSSKVPLIGFSREKSWSSGEIPLEITIGDAPLARKETLNFVIVKSNSPYNMLLGRTTMQKMGIMVSTIHGAIKFHTTKGVRTVFSTYESDKVIINNKYPEQTITIERQLPEHFKGRLRDLLRANANVFAWTHADMTAIPRTIMVEGKPFNTEHKLSEYSYVKPIKQKRRDLGPDRNTAACKEVEELT